MKSNIVIILAAAMLVACGGNSEKQLRQRAAELCRYVPDHELQKSSKAYMTTDFYAVLDTMFNHLPEYEGMDCEWLYYFVTGNGGTVADYDVTAVEQTDARHAVATVMVRQKFADGMPDEASEIEEHKLFMEKTDGEWLISDFDGRKADCLRHIASVRKEQAVRQAITDYLVKDIGKHYVIGEICVPTLMMVHEEDGLFMGDFSVLWYNQVGDTLKCISGGNHSGTMTLKKKDGRYSVTAFEQTVDGAGNEASARRIFGSYFDIYQSIHSNEKMREAARREQLREYVHQHNLSVHFYQDYGWPAVAI